jgi:hypothetical protein
MNKIVSKCVQTLVSFKNFALLYSRVGAGAARAASKFLPRAGAGAARSRIICSEPGQSRGRAGAEPEQSRSRNTMRLLLRRLRLR